MTTHTLHPLAAEYLERLRRAGRGLPSGRRRELLAEIEGHLSEAIEPGASDAQALTVLTSSASPRRLLRPKCRGPTSLRIAAAPGNGPR
ncbi:MAG: HAAS signaling domain-containing protein [Solirubrobacteraceae bacterium]